MSKRPQPTDSELEILEILWRQGPSTVRQVHEERQGGVGYTTILKLMQIMADKGLLERDTSSRSHIYRPVEAPDRTRSRLVGDLIDRAFSGSAGQLVLNALSNQRASAEELREIRALLASLESEETSK